VPLIHQITAERLGSASLSPPSLSRQLVEASNVADYLESVRTLSKATAPDDTLRRREGSRGRFSRDVVRHPGPKKSEPIVPTANSGRDTRNRYAIAELYLCCARLCLPSPFP
jgi:hypothetical protein